MKRIISLVVCLVLVYSVFFTDVRAAYVEQTISSETTVFSDGSYCITTIQQESEDTQCRSASTKTGSKTRSYYNAADELQFTVVVRGTFTYDGTTATAISSNCGYTIKNTNWSFVSSNSFAADNRAVATCTFHLSNVGNKTYTVTLSCSPTGVLS